MVGRVVAAFFNYFVAICEGFYCGISNISYRGIKAINRGNKYCDWGLGPSPLYDLTKLLINVPGTSPAPFPQ